MRAPCEWLAEYDINGYNLLMFEWFILMPMLMLMLMLMLRLRLRLRLRLPCDCRCNGLERVSDPVAIVSLPNWLDLHQVVMGSFICATNKGRKWIHQPQKG